MVVEGEGTLTMTFTPKDEGEPIEMTSMTSPVVASRWRCTTTTIRSVTLPGLPSVTASSAATRSTMSTKNTIMKRYDGRFMILFQEVFDDEFRTSSTRPGSPTSTA